MNEVGEFLSLLDRIQIKNFCFLPGFLAIFIVCHQQTMLHDQYIVSRVILDNRNIDLKNVKISINVKINFYILKIGKSPTN